MEGSISLPQKEAEDLVVTLLLTRQAIQANLVLTGAWFPDSTIPNLEKALAYLMKATRGAVSDSNSKSR